MSLDKKSLLLYAVTDTAWVGRLSLLEQIENALCGGVTMLQLREKTLNEYDFIKEAIAVKKLCSRYGVPLIVNDNIDVAVKSGADGIHVGQSDIPVGELRKKYGKDILIGATAKTVKQAYAAQKSGADYLGVGAVFPSPTKKDAVRITKTQLKAITDAVNIPCVAIGGIDIDNLDEIKGCGIAGVAVVSAVFGAEDIRLSCQALKNKILSIL